MTSSGAVTAHGLGVERLFQALIAGHSAVRKSARFIGHCLCSELAAEAPADADLLAVVQPFAGTVPPDRATRLLLAAAAEAVGTRALLSDPRRGVIVGTTKGALELTMAAWDRKEPAEVDPLALPARALALAMKAEGPVRTVSAACASSSAALGEGLNWIADGLCDEVVVGGTEALHPFVYDGFHALKAISPQPAAPFDAHRMGLSLGEGAGVVVLQSIDRAWATGRTGVQIAGYGGACDSHDLTAPDPLGGGLIAACRRAIARAGTSVDAIGCYHAHGTATQHNDAMENAAVRTLFAGRPVLVTGIKGSIGHTLGAAGILDAIACSAYLARGVLPPVTNLVEVDPTMSLQPVMGRPVEKRVEWAITATAGFGGINTALVLRAPGTIA